MFRAAVLSIVLTLAVGPSAGLLCKTWCNPQAAAADGGHHAASTASTSVAADDTCEDLGLGAAAFLREDVRRGVSAPERDHAVVALPYHLARTTTDDRSREHAHIEWSLEKRPLSTTLRI